MKLTARDIPGFVKAPPANIYAILIYGPDEGQVREQGTAIGKTVIEDLSDPFNVVEISQEKLLDDPASLLDEACAMSMMGGRRLIRLRGLTDKSTKHLAEIVPQLTSNENLIVIEAGDLPARSSLRKLFEKEKTTAALPCYVQDEQSLSRFISQALREDGLNIDQDALQLLAANLVGDRAVARGEIQKLALYMYNAENKTITLKDIEDSIGNSAALSLDDVSQFCASGETAKMDRKMQQIFMEGTNPIAQLRITQNYFRRLHLVKSAMEQGASQDEALKMLRPPLFFKTKPLFIQQLRLWPLKQLNMALEKLTEAEADCKKTGMPPETICNRLFFSLSYMASRHRR